MMQERVEARGTIHLPVRSKQENEDHDGCHINAYALHQKYRSVLREGTYHLNFQGAAPFD